MQNINNLRNSIFIFLLLFIFSGDAYTQIPMQARDYVVHDRGMLHNTLYNTGEISQVWQRDIDFKVAVPYMKWPPYSRTIIDAREYDGHNNSFGGAIMITANYKGDRGIWEEEGRLGAFCGGVGKGEPVPAFGKWSFPVSIEMRENYPVLEDGTLNPNFDPEEAEQISTAVWNTNIGIQVTRVSRSWSYPDYDDIIVHEYTLENNGVYFDQIESKLVQRDTTLVDVLVNFNYGISPSQLGSIRATPTLHWDLYDKYYSPSAFFDYHYWLQYNQVTNDRIGDMTKAGRPEPNLENFLENAQTGKNGGGLLSPQAAGFSILYYDTEHLSIIDTVNAERNQSEQYIDPQLNIPYDADYENYRTQKGEWLDLGPDGKILQPYFVYRGKDPCQLPKIWEKIANFQERYGSYWDPDDPEYEGPEDLLPDNWRGRSIPWNGPDPGGGHGTDPTRAMGFGLYYMEPGDKIEFTVAEVVGYGADPEIDVFGGYTSSRAYEDWATTGWFWDRPVKVEGEIVTENYVEDFGLPDYVNSDVVTVQDVAHKAFELYTGSTIPPWKEWDLEDPPVWPKKNPKNGLYTVEIPIPAPAIQTKNTDTGSVVINWKKNVEDFENQYSDYVTGKLDRFEVYRASAKMGPWTKLGTVNVGEYNDSGEYEFIDTDRNFLLEETKYYSVVSVDEFGNPSGRTNITKHKKNMGPLDQLEDVYIVPNPFVVESGFTGGGAERMLGIYGLPEKCTIYIYSFAGQRITTIEHDAPEYSDNWEQITRNNQNLASGMYFYVVKTPDGGKTSGKFLIIK